MAKRHNCIWIPFTGIDFFSSSSANTISEQHHSTPLSDVCCILSKFKNEDTWHSEGHTSGQFLLEQAHAFKYDRWLTWWGRARHSILCLQKGQLQFHQRTSCLPCEVFLTHFQMRTCTWLHQSNRVCHFLDARPNHPLPTKPVTCYPWSWWQQLEPGIKIDTQI